MAQGMSAGIHYVDDFLTFDSSEAECARNLEILCHVCQQLGFPLAQDNREGPSQKISFLGIELDCWNLEMRLPADKLRDVRRTGTYARQRQSDNCYLSLGILPTLPKW